LAPDVNGANALGPARAEFLWGVFSRARVRARIRKKIRSKWLVFHDSGSGMQQIAAKSGGRLLAVAVLVREVRRASPEIPSEQGIFRDLTGKTAQPFATRMFSMCSRQVADPALAGFGESRPCAAMS
jgi:hypothetical protein